VAVNDETATIAQQVDGSETIAVDGNLIHTKKKILVLVNKPMSYVCSKQSQDDKPTIYELLPTSLQHLSYAGRLDADSKGLVIMTNDGQLIQHLTHPKFEVMRTYEVMLNKKLATKHLKQLSDLGVELDDGLSKFDQIEVVGSIVHVALHEGRNRQIRRTFGLLGYEVVSLKRTSHGPYSLDDIPSGEYRTTDIT